VLVSGRAPGKGGGPRCAWREAVRGTNPIGTNVPPVGDFAALGHFGKSLARVAMEAGVLVASTAGCSGDWASLKY